MWGRVARIEAAGAMPPTPTCSGEADVVRASQLPHAVEHVDRHVHLGGAPLIGMRAQPVPNHALVPADRGLSAGPLRIPGRFLPSQSALLGGEVEGRSRWVGAL